jgi:hypothetical protein
MQIDLFMEQHFYDDNQHLNIEIIISDVIKNQESRIKNQESRIKP